MRTSSHSKCVLTQQMTQSKTISARYCRHMLHKEPYTCREPNVRNTQLQIVQQIRKHLKDMHLVQRPPTPGDGPSSLSTSFTPLLIIYPSCYLLSLSIYHRIYTTNTSAQHALVFFGCVPSYILMCHGLNANIWRGHIHLFFNKTCAYPMPWQAGELRSAVIVL